MSKRLEQQGPLGDTSPIRSMRQLWQEYGNLTISASGASGQGWSGRRASISDGVPSTTSEMREFLDSVRETLGAVLRETKRANMDLDTRADVIGAITVLGQLFGKDHFLYGPICNPHLNMIASCANGCG